MLLHTQHLSVHGMQASARTHESAIPCPRRPACAPVSVISASASSSSKAASLHEHALICSLLLRFALSLDTTNTQRVGLYQGWLVRGFSKLSSCTVRQSLWLDGLFERAFACRREGLGGGATVKSLFLSISNTPFLAQGIMFFELAI
eukprot:scaffold1270_cov19-Tisochrysis_lutea.AAC.1